MRARKSFGIAAVVGALLTAALAVYLQNNPHKAARPVITALERYRVRYGAYPAALNELIAAQLLSVIPSVPSDLSVRRDSFDYFSDPDLDLFGLSYAECPWFGGIGPPKARGRGYVSYLGKWVLDTDSRLNLTDPRGLALDRAGFLFRTGGSSQALDLFVSKVVFYCNRDPTRARSIMKDELLEALGHGDVLEIDGKQCLRYSATDKTMATYYFVLSGPSPLTGEHGIFVLRILRTEDQSSSGHLREIFSFTPR